MSNLLSELLGGNAIEKDISRDESCVRSDESIRSLKSSMTEDEWQQYQADWYAKHIAKM